MTSQAKGSGPVLDSPWNKTVARANSPVMNLLRERWQLEHPERPHPHYGSDRTEEICLLFPWHWKMSYFQRQESSITDFPAALPPLKPSCRDSLQEELLRLGSLDTRPPVKCSPEGRSSSRDRSLRSQRSEVL